MFYILFPYCTENEPNRDLKTKVHTAPWFLAYRYIPSSHPLYFIYSHINSHINILMAVNYEMPH